jgi:hypothetical protein
MRITSSLILAATILAIAAPANAKTSIQKGEQACKEAAEGQQPAPKSVRVDKDETRVNNDVLTFTLRVKNADDSSAKLVCNVDRSTDAATVAAAS